MGFPKIRDITLRILKTCGIDSPPVPLGPIIDRFKARVVESDNVADDYTVELMEGDRDMESPEARRAFFDLLLQTRSEDMVNGAGEFVWLDDSGRDE